MSVARDARRRATQLLGTIVSLLIASSAPLRSAVAQRPLDPLTAREMELAQRLTRADPRVRELVGQRKAIVGATAFIALKPESAEVTRARGDIEPIRAAVVFLYVYEGDYGVRALIDLPRSSVLRVDRLDHERIPFAAEEIATAQQLALRDERLRATLGRTLAETRVEWLGFTPPDERDPCFRHRCVQLLYRRGNAFLMRPIVIVDLTTQTVRLEEPER